jgi:hypothetical protein
MTLQGVLQILRNDQDVTRACGAEHVRHYRGRELAKAIERVKGAIAGGAGFVPTMASVNDDWAQWPEHDPVGPLSEALEGCRCYLYPSADEPAECAARTPREAGCMIVTVPTPTPDGWRRRALPRESAERVALAVRAAIASAPTEREAHRMASAAISYWAAEMAEPAES